MSVQRYSRLQAVIRHDWWALLLVAGIPPLVLLVSLYIVGVPQDFAIWQYAPPAISSIAVIESVRLAVLHQDVWFAQPHTNHMTIGVAWFAAQFLPSTQYVFIVIYLVATMTTAIVTYVVARITRFLRVWALLLALCFTLLPARFWFVDISTHWWLAMPLVWLVVAHWWQHAEMVGHISWRYYAPLVVIPLLGWDQLWWSVFALVIAALIAASIRHDWRWRHLGSALFPLVLMTSMLQILSPIDTSSAPGGGIRLLELVVPHRTHWIPWLATFGERIFLLEIDRTSTVYAGLLAVVGIALMIGRAVRHLLTPNSSSAQPLFVWLLILLLVGTLHGLSVLLVWFGVSVAPSQFMQLFVVFGALVTTLYWFQSLPIAYGYRIVFVIILMLIDQVPATNIMRHMSYVPRDIPVTTLDQGLWFGQQLLPRDVISVSGLSSIEPGFGRWSDAALADRVLIRVSKPMATSMTFEIRARGVGSNVGAPIQIRIGDEIHVVTLDTVVKPYLVTFVQPRGDVIEIIPQPVPTPPAGELRRIGIFLQSIRVIHQ